MVRRQSGQRVWRSRGGLSASPTSKSASEESSSVESTSSSAASQVNKDDRLLHIDKVIQTYAAFCTLQDNLQTAHYSLLKAKQQARDVTWIDAPMPGKLNETIQSLVEVLHITADYKPNILREMAHAQVELLGPTIYRKFDLSPSVDEELRDVRENCFPHSP